MADLSRRDLMVGGVVTAAAAVIPAPIVELHPACINATPFITRLWYDKATRTIKRQVISQEEFYG